MQDGPGGSGLSRKAIWEQIDASLARLGTDYVDLYQIHRFDPGTPVAETMEALHDIVKAGKARYLGASSMYAWQFAQMLQASETHGWTRFVSMQNHYNLVYREEEREMMPLCRHEGIGVIPWSPLARGLLAGNRGRSGETFTKRAETDEYARILYTEGDFETVDRVAKIAQKRGVSPAQVALAWILQQPGVSSPIIGATKMAQFDESIAAVDITLDAEECKFLEEPYRPHAVLGHH